MYIYIYIYIWQFLICCLVRNPPFSVTAKLTSPKLHTADTSAL